LFYPNARTIAAAARDLVEGRPTGWLPDENPDFAKVEFKGPF
jgi:acetoin:2,6-dichlorophenolindophenol oxidoreductase subunit beta